MSSIRMIGQDGKPSQEVISVPFAKRNELLKAGKAVDAHAPAPKPQVQDENRAEKRAIDLSNALEAEREEKAEMAAELEKQAKEKADLLAKLNALEAERSKPQGGGNKPSGGEAKK